MEVAPIKDPRQRADVAAIMEELSDFTTLVSQAVIARLEVDAALDAIAGPKRQVHLPVPLLGQGVLHAFGRPGGWTEYFQHGAIASFLRGSVPSDTEGFDALIERAQLYLERELLRGPTDAQVAALKAAGWDPTVARQHAERRAAFERELVTMLSDDPYWRVVRLRDVIASRFVMHEINEILAGEVSVRGIDVEMAWAEPGSMRALIDSMPSGDASVSLFAAVHRNAKSRWTREDIFDMQALTLAVPYCDAVVTDRHACHILHSAGLPARMETVVLASLEELADLLDD
jgi:hypothetical protein